MLAGDQVGFPSSEALKSTTTRYQVHCCFCPCKDQRRVRQQLPLSLCLMRKKKTAFSTPPFLRSIRRRKIPHLFEHPLVQYEYTIRSGTARQILRKLLFIQCRGGYDMHVPVQQIRYVRSSKMFFCRRSASIHRLPRAASGSGRTFFFRPW